MRETRSFFSVQRIIFGLLTLACMVTIFCFSMDDAKRSSSKSGNVTETIVEIVVSDYDELPPSKQMSIMDKAEHIVRKCAHFTIFMTLGFMASCTVGRRKAVGFGSLGVLGFCFLYACSDEFHQKFVPGRACMFTDVMIDTSGAFIGMTISLLVMFIIAAIANRSGKKEQNVSD